jgi:hypothetical protein
MSIKKYKRINNLLFTKFGKLFKKNEVYSITNLELLKGTNEELVLEKAYYKSFYNCFNIVLRLRNYENIFKLKDFIKVKKVAFCSSVFSFQYYSLFRHSKGAEVMRAYINTSPINAAAFHFSQNRSLRMFLNVQSINATRMLKKMDYNTKISSEIVHERLNKKLYVQTLLHIVPQYIVLFGRKFAYEEIRKVFEHIVKLNTTAVLGFNTALINMCFIFIIYYFIFIITIFIQIIGNVDFLINQITKFRKI